MKNNNKQNLSYSNKEVDLWTEDDFTWDEDDSSILTGLNPKYLNCNGRVVGPEVYKDKLAKTAGKLAKIIIQLEKLLIYFKYQLKQFKNG